MANATKRTTIVGLHYVRAFATIAVVVVHVCGAAGQPNYFDDIPFNKFFWNGAGEVDLFFMMSGFIMVASTHDVVTGLPRISTAEFMRRRLIRVLPLMWLAVISYVLLRYWGTGVIDWREFARSLTVWPVGTVTPFVVWTIRHEILFYSIFAICFIAFPRYRAVSLVWFLLPLAAYPLYSDSTIHSDQYGHFFASPFNLEFGIGVLMGLLYRNFGAPVRVRHYGVLILAIMLVLRLLSWRYDLQTGSLTMVVAIMPLCALLMFCAIKYDPASGSKLVMFFGDASYSTFLFHPHLTSPILGVLGRYQTWMSVEIASAIAVALILVITSAIHVLVEKPMLTKANVALQSIRNRKSATAAQ